MTERSGQGHPARLLAAVALALGTLPWAACATTAPHPNARAFQAAHLTAPSGAPARVLAAGQQLSERAQVGKSTRAHVAIANDSDQPILLLGATPQRAGDDPLSLIERVHGVAAYDAEDATITVERPRFPGEAVAIHHGLLLPGESIQLYTSACPTDEGFSAHDYRLDFITAPWETLRQHLYLAGPLLAGGQRVFQRHEMPPADLAVPRLRRAILADGHQQLTHGAVRFRVVLGPVERSPMPLAEAYRIAGLEPGTTKLTYSDLLGGWAFERPRGVVCVRPLAQSRERIELKAVTVAALRALDRHPGAVPIVFEDAEAYLALRDLIVTTDAGDDGVPQNRVPRDRLHALLAAVEAAHVTLDAVAPALTITAKDPAATPLLVRR